jgi:predicted outer membrane repeat protein
MDRGLKRKGFAVIGVLLFCTMAMQTLAATITVINTNDSGPGSLRQALAVAHNGDRITFAVSGAIALTDGGLLVTKNVTISGPGADQLAVDGNQAVLVFEVFPERTVSISGLSIRNAQVGVLNEQGTLSVSNCVLSGNSIAGLYNRAKDSVGASMTVANSIISNNSGTGAINLFPFQLDASGHPCACMTITDSVVSNNAADGIFNVSDAVNEPASLTVVNSNVSDNDGGGISNEATEAIVTATIVSATVSGNSTGGVETFGECGLVGFGQVTITNSTISGNSANGGIRSHLSALTVADTTISGNSSGDTGGGIHASSLANGPMSVL